MRLEFEEGSLRLTAGGDDEGSAEEQLPCSFAGEPLTIAFNPGYLLDGLGALGSEAAHLSFTTPSRPALLRPASAPGEDGAEGEVDADEASATAVEPGPGRRRRAPGAAAGLPLPADAGPPAGLIAVRTTVTTGARAGRKGPGPP